ncbi:AAA family ATPase [Lysinibacillus fusiformis]|uniref:AAA family ATPase n=1 Tax=Lysinibacillus fusiformis TaxID=28031 RepID=UPI003CFED414
MLKKFSVANFRNFNEELLIDFSNTRDYKFNEICIKDGLINKGIIYGRNAEGKSNLGKALIDIRSNLVDDFPSSKNNFFNAFSNKDEAVFKYEFLFDSKTIKYCYKKDSNCELIFEELQIENKTLFSYDFIKEDGDFDEIASYDETKNLNFKYWKKNKSILKYIINNSEGIEIIDQLMTFVNGMAIVRPSDKSLSFIGPQVVKNGGIINSLIEQSLVGEFHTFLKQAGIDLPLMEDVKPDGQKSLYINFKRPIEFVTYASSGTLALLGIFRILKSLDSITFLYIDEFDANFHFELAEYILDYIKKEVPIQTLITTHNTDLMSNKYMRPDCYFILINGKLNSVPETTIRELRQGHNLEKLYQSGEFTNQ